ncbi:MAG TPA: hypothetical protein VK841_22455 [Polyangiaceae bacterium]|jgi:hypothetical protein|nr:hypothetical protein [Polyangiaceae bacterium]
MSTADELLDAIADLAEDERRVLLAIAKRLSHGARLYGKLDVEGDRRDWRAEGAEELLDGCVYLACESLRKSESNETYIPTGNEESKA